MAAATVTDAKKTARGLRRSPRRRSAGAIQNLMTTDATVTPPQILPSPQAAGENDSLPRKASAKLTKVSIVTPVYNEEATVQSLIELVVKAPLPQGLRREIICVNDCSKDGTARKL